MNAIWSDALVNHIAERKTDGVRVAFLSAIRADFRNGHCYFAVLAAPDFTRTVFAGEAIFLFFVQLMENFPLRKIYFETAEFNAAQFAPALARFAVEEGRLREYEYYNGQYWDYLIFSVSRETVERRMAPLVRWPMHVSHSDDPNEGEK